MAGGVAVGRLTEERKAWRKSHPHGFTAKPETSSDGSANMLLWHCTIPGLPNTDWSGGYYPLSIHFCEDYPTKPPKCTFPPNFFHPNVYKRGEVCLSILNVDDGWSPSISVKQILFGIQAMLGRPNPHSAAQSDVRNIFINEPDEYRRRVRQQAQRFPLSR